MLRPSLVSSLSLSLCVLAGCSSHGGSSAADASGPKVARAQIARVSAESIPASSLAAAVSANNAFALDLYAELAPGGQNLLTSPLSAELALGMTYAGAKGQTASEMATALHFDPVDNAALFDGQNALSQALAARSADALSVAAASAAQGQKISQDPGDYDLNLVNSVWGEQTYPWQTPFLEILARDYGTGVYLEDFIDQPDPARQRINQWVSAQTNQKINDLLAPAAVDDTTRMVLVSALHLKFPWATAFDPALTTSGSFTLADGTLKQASFMNQLENLPYLDDGQAQIASLPLYGGKLAIVIALPHADVTLASYEASLPAHAATAQPPSSSPVSLSLPKLTFSSATFSLADALRALGMTQLFDPATADLTGMCAQTPDDRRLSVSDVLQKTMISFEETGAEAAAATAVTVVGTIELAPPPPPPPISMVVNRPYLVTVLDVPTGTVLMLGRIADPTASGG